MENAVIAKIYILNVTGLQYKHIQTNILSSRLINDLVTKENALGYIPKAI